MYRFNIPVPPDDDFPEVVVAQRMGEGFEKEYVEYEPRWRLDRQRRSVVADEKFFYAMTDTAERLRAYARRYGVPVEVCHPHSFRHMFGQEFMRRNGNITLLADLMGHSSVATTQIYTRMSEEEQMRQLDEAVTW